ncbi:MAG TPA: PrsW family glutamic-type intramembrane protease [Caulobacteraceae bacterium]|nr:PrsW family glutamic-type intramembrane protease [Caulobacteraceae bacterium]
MELIVIKSAVAIAPVLVMLGAFALLDAFKLVSWRQLALLLIGGGALAVVSYFVNGRFLDTLPIGFSRFSQFGAPPIEESLKAALVLALFLRNRIGFMIDAAISGVAVGAGFSVVENGIYLGVFTHATVGVWLVRGFGTALMHAGCTALFAVSGQFLTERYARIESQRHRFEALAFLPGLAAAVLLHGLFNQAAPNPILGMTTTLFVVPLVLFLVFVRSEHGAHRWLLTEYESHRHMLDDIRAGRLADSPAGRFVAALGRHYPPAVAADMFRYIQVHTWLVTRAEADLIAREAGHAVPPTDAVRKQLAELHALERRIGKSALMVLNPHLHFTRSELWEIHELEAHVAHAHRLRPRKATA